MLQLAVLHLLAVIVTRVVFELKVEYIDFIKDGLSDVMNTVNIE